jgi:hypothetical protein
MVELGKNRPIADLGAIEEEEFPGLGESFLKPGVNTIGTTKKEEGSERSEANKSLPASGQAQHEGVIRNLDNLI